MFCNYRNNLFVPTYRCYLEQSNGLEIKTLGITDKFNQSNDQTDNTTI